MSMEKYLKRTRIIGHINLYKEQGIGLYEHKIFLCTSRLTCVFKQVTESIIINRF